MSKFNPPLPKDKLSWVVVVVAIILIFPVYYLIFYPTLENEYHRRFIDVKTYSINVDSLSNPQVEEDPSRLKVKVALPKYVSNFMAREVRVYITNPLPTITSTPTSSHSFETVKPPQKERVTTTPSPYGGGRTPSIGSPPVTPSPSRSASSSTNNDWELMLILSAHYSLSTSTPQPTTSRQEGDRSQSVAPHTPSLTPTTTSAPSESILFCSEENRTSTTCRRSDGFVVFEEIPTGATVMRTLWITGEHVKEKQIDIYLSALVKQGDESEWIRLHSKEITGKVEVEGMMTLIQSVIKTILLPPWSNSFLVALVVFVVWLFMPADNGEM